jgi:hypothetical protein
MSSIEQNPNCLKCAHFAVTWDASFPRSCTLFGFKTRTLPSVEVRKSTGNPCPAYNEKAVFSAGQNPP